MATLSYHQSFFLFYFLKIGRREYLNCIIDCVAYMLCGESKRGQPNRADRYCR